VITFWVYMLRCSDGSYYVGHTDNLDMRMSQHEMGTLGGYTSLRRPVELVFAQECSSREEALQRERQIKGWSRGKKEALIHGDWTEVVRLARKPARTTSGT
jgi:predicted GIY-YIG superfamily endonuclease